MGSFECFADVTYILKMCLKKFGAEKIFFDKLAFFLA